MKIKELMTKQVQTCRTTDTLNVPAQLMWEHDCGAIPVLDSAGKVVSMITDRDICMATHLQGLAPSSIQVDTVMSKDLFSCAPNDTIMSAESTMRKHCVRRLPVLDRKGALVGVLSLSDLAREYMRENQDDVRGGEVAETLGTICQSRPTSLPAQSVEVPPQSFAAA